MSNSSKDLREKEQEGGLLPPSARDQSSGTHSRDPNDPPGFEDEYQMLPETSANGSKNGNSVNLGDQDLYPMGVGKFPPMKPFIDPLSGSSPQMGGGMTPSANDPLFSRNTNRGNSNNGSLMRPPGARWDDPLFGGGDASDPLQPNFGQNGDANNSSGGFGFGGGNGFGGF